MRVLAGDIGGTKTALAIIEARGDRITVVRAQRFPSAAHSGLAEIVEQFLAADRLRPVSAAFGVAGPVRAGRAKVTKLPWRLDEVRLAQALGLPRVRLLNDFVAAALGLRFVRHGNLVTLCPGRAEAGSPVGILGAGTGLGQAAVIRRGSVDEVIASEGGHVDFGPRNAVEDRLVEFLRDRFGRATRDRILSGGGLGLIYEFLKAERFAPESRAVAQALAREDPASVISRLGLSRRDRLCSATLDLFVSIYGSETGNLALQYRATGGVFLGGGIAPRILPALRRPAFERAFRAKAPMEELLARIPVRVVLDPRLGLLGAAASAYFTTMETTRSRSKTMTRPALS